MLSSISPFGERSRNSRWWLTVTAYLLGSVVGGATTGLLAGAAGQLALGWLSGDAALVAFAGIALVGVLADLGIAVATPSWHRQVNEDWLTTYRGWVYGGGFGFQLGLGVVTIVTTATVWVAWAAAALSASWWAGLAIGVVFGAARGSLILATRSIDNPDALRALFRRIAQQAPSIHRLAVVAGVLTAATALGGVVA